jgi:hypothetical protein
MSDPYPEVTGDESGIVPPQTARSPDWPKKIRTLTAAELDRLTIDGAGRFYWDGKLVNYDSAQPKPPERPEDKPIDPIDPAAFEILDRAAQELSGGKTAGSTESERRSHAADLSAIDIDLRPAGSAAQVAADEAPEAQTMVVPAAPRYRVPEVVRLRLSWWQSLGFFLAVLGITVGASGLAAYGFVVVHDWGCRSGLVQSYCPPAPAARPAPPRPDIPA